MDKLAQEDHSYCPSSEEYNPFSSIPKVAFVFFFLQFFVVAVESKLVELIFFKFVVAGSFTADGNLLQPTVGVNSTPHTSPLSRS